MDEALHLLVAEFGAARDRWRERGFITLMILALVAVVVSNPVGLAAQAALPAAFVLVALFVASCMRGDHFGAQEQTARR